MNIPTYDQWKKDTSLGIFRPRSAVLQALDQAIDKWNQSKTNENLWGIKNSLEAWKRSKGAGWAQNERNRTGAVKRLDVDLESLDSRTYQITHMSMEELKALEYMSQERKKVMKTLFQGKQVKFKAANLTESLKQTANDVKIKSGQAMASIQNKLTSKPTPGPKPVIITGMGMAPGGGGMGTNLGSGRTAKDIIQSKLTEMVQKFFEVDSVTLLGPLGSLIMSIVAECAASTAPVIGHIKDGVGAVNDWVEVGVGLYKKHSISECAYSIDLGAPSAAFAALQRLLKEEVNHSAISASISSTSFIVKTGLLFADGGAISGPVTGAVAALAQIAHKLYLLGMEYRATRDVNEALKADKLDITLFNTYPLMGCYMLNCATLSDIIPIKCFATPGWMDYIEKMKKNAFDDIIKESVSLIDKSPWEIQGMPKKPAGGSGGLFSEGKRFRTAFSPLGDLADLRKIGKG